MKMRNWLMLLALAALLILGACSKSSGSESDSSGSADFPTMKITFSHNQPLESPEHAGAAKFKEIVEEGSGGKITVDVYPASQLGSLREQVESTQMGEIDITMQPTAVVTPFVDDVKIGDLPYLWPAEADKMYEVLDSEVGDEILTTLDQGGFKGLGFWPGGYKLMTTKNTAIKSPADMKGLTMRVMESPLLIEQYKVWGATAIPVPYAEVYNSLQQGIVDGQENPLQTVFLNNYHEVQKNVIETFHGSMTYLLMANKGWFDGLAPNVQELIQKADEEGKKEARQVLKEKEDDYRQQIIDSGVEYYKLTDDEIAAFHELSEPFWDEIYNTAEQKELLKKVKEKISQVSK
ncbi:TRAP transporter substrate-binding protein [Sporosarcina sp. 179-K 8C2 HS]|uniref:TRAP transporter substrate-binding protein n=1 Tax=Sporosarcina sp. 179-K 8C2 HS TaxID=3142387 RepID=UPI0039A111E5